MNLLQELIEMVRELAGTDDALHFDYPLVIKTSPHRPAFQIWCVHVSPEGALYVGDPLSDYYQVKEGGAGSDLIIASVYQRVKIIYSIIKKNEEVEK